MKLFFLIIILFSLSCCGTVGGAVRGLGSDLDIVGSYITDFWKKFDPFSIFLRIYYVVLK